MLLFGFVVCFGVFVDLEGRSGITLLEGFTSAKQETKKMKKDSFEDFQPPSNESLKSIVAVHGP